MYSDTSRAAVWRVEPLERQEASEFARIKPTIGFMVIHFKVARIDVFAPELLLEL